LQRNPRAPVAARNGACVARRCHAEHYRDDAAGRLARHAGADAGDAARYHHLADRAQEQLPALAQGCWTARLRAFLDAFWGLLLIVIVIGGIYGGIFTPTEAAAMSAVYAFVIAVFVYRDLSLREVPGVLLASANLCAMLLYIITNAVCCSPS
jgi:TRAP-type mannitol/chloroaromatic compound transport system permease large subunit